MKGRGEFATVYYLATSDLTCSNPTWTSLLSRLQLETQPKSCPPNSRGENTGLLQGLHDASGQVTLVTFHRLIAAYKRFCMYVVGCDELVNMQDYPKITEN